jgi:small subunit ribosomal protein S1
VFVELRPGVDGLLHLSEIPRSRQGAMREAASAGGEVTVMIVSVDADKRRIGLALAPDDAVPGAQVKSAVEVGAVLVGTVERIEPFGVFVRLGPGQTGLVPNAELATGRGTDPRKAFPVDSEMKVLVLAVEEGGRRIRLSQAGAIAQEEKVEAQAYVQDTTKKSGGFGMTIGEKLKQARQTGS